MSSRRFTATQQTTIRDLQRIMTKISATSLRLDKVHHPDAGRHEEDFKRLRTAYDQGMSIAKQRRVR